MIKTRINRFAWILILFGMIWFAGCSSGNPPAGPLATPTLTILRIAYTPAAQPALAAFYACNRSNEQGLIVDEIPAQAINLEGYDIVLQLGEPNPAQGILAPLGQEHLVVIVHPDNPVNEMDRQQVRDLFSGEVRRWDSLVENLGFVQPWIALPGEETRLMFDRAILENSPVSADAMFAPDPASMREQVAGDPLAIGYIPAAWLDDTVKEVVLDSDILKEQTLPLLAETTANPPEAVRDMLLCLQSQTGQDVLFPIYQPWR